MTKEEYEKEFGQHPEEELGADWELFLGDYKISDGYCPMNNCGNSKGLEDATCGDASSH